MKFYNALLLLAATLTLTLGNGLDVSDIEDNISGVGLEDGFGESSEPEIDTNMAPVETPEAPETPVIVPPSFPSVDNNVPTTDSIPPPSMDSVNSNPVTDSVNTNPSVDSVPPYSDNTGVTPPSAEGISGQNVDNGEASDDYGSTDQIDQIDNADVNPQDVVDDGEASDDYGNADGIDQVDGIDSANANDVTSDDEDEGLSTSGKVASGLAGAAALSSAGVFYYIKKSKRAGLQSVRTQITMV
ncbi:hypothetical protein BCR36DRAFT_583159 [Piromyces finnis]|uniref:Uncharacterized protein n=1 Tax=Piromyces finnis TaxID=1754191 RepID=A0A1Y1VAF5_9FUNG|nr:hypothetical protein BCR36DRAFT_583159 [Piromyces finnis]|eukprot:ORX51099.1 hypothetical protein BCR36DRAFT_583159 [Piromyces finnis]